MAGLRVCVVGSGASGMILSKALLSGFPGLAITMVERLSQPFGLVRAAIAPDRRALKNLQRSFVRTLDDPSVSLTLRADLLGHASLPELLRHFSAVFLAVGGEERRLGLPGESLEGVVLGSRMHMWLNGAPEAPTTCPLRLSESPTVFMMGNGNAALDIARFLLSSAPPPACRELLSSSVREELSRSAVRELRIFARKPPDRPAFTPILLSELMRIPDLNVLLDESDFAGLGPPGTDARSVELQACYRQIRSRPFHPSGRTLRLHFLHSDLGFLGDERNERLRALSFLHRSERVTIPTNNVILSLGYHTLFPSDGVRVRGQERSYCVGWCLTDGKGDLGETSRSVKSAVAEFAADVKEPLPLEALLARYGVEGAIPWSAARTGVVASLP